MIISHLAQLGHKDIAMSQVPSVCLPGLSAIKDICRGLHKLVSKPTLIYLQKEKPSQRRRVGGSASKILATRQKFTAIVAGNDLMALGCYDELMAKGLKCPEDVSVVGFDDMPFAGHFNPPLTTVHTPLLDIGAEVARILLEQIEEADLPPRTQKLRPELIVRASTDLARG